ncbi:MULTISPECIES: DUF5518 domain-containing protein [Haloarcula]|uniref:DUF5518 domain-containing protein n=1 Tax=Haloarcula TaxID=2237 RepID=UPI0023E76835|nr:DUF5518 domain-containing protein [Halomicroarcula sp. SHR3]
MPSIRSIPPAGSPERQYALLGGLAAVPFTATSYSQADVGVSLWPVFWGGLLAGYLVKRREGDGTPVGFDAGVLGVLPGLQWFYDEFGHVLGQPVDPGVVAEIALLVAMLFPIFLALGGLAGAVGGRLGGWLAEVNGHPEQPVEVS